MLSPFALSMALAAQVLLGGSTAVDRPFVACGVNSPVCTPTANVDSRSGWQEARLAVPDGGRIEFTSITVPDKTVVRFTRNGRNDPVMLLATESVSIVGVIDLNGQLGTTIQGGAGGPGGYDGGAPGFGGTPGGGHGPGGGIYNGDSLNYQNGSAAHSTVYSGASARLYGAQPCFPLVGGSGGAGSTTVGGGGGGGAILIATEGPMTIAGTVMADAGGSSSSAGGSGGCIRLVAPKVVVTGNVHADFNYRGGYGYVRIDSIDKTGIAGTRSPSAAPGGSIGSNMVVELQPMPSVNLISVAGFPTNGLPFFKTLLPGSPPTSQPVAVEFEIAAFPQCASVTIRVVPSTGPAVETGGEILANGTHAATVIIPANTATAVEVYGKAQGCLQ